MICQISSKFNFWTKIWLLTQCESVYAQLKICLSTLNKTRLQSLITLAFKESLLMMSFAMNFPPILELNSHYIFKVYRIFSAICQVKISRNFIVVKKNCVMNCSSFRCRLPNIFFYKKGDVNVGNCRSFPLAINRLNWGSLLLQP